MTGERANVDRALYISALHDAIDWQRSILATHDGSPNDGSGRIVLPRCEPGARCADYRREHERFMRYSKALATLNRTRRRGAAA